MDDQGRLVRNQQERVSQALAQLQVEIDRLTRLSVRAVPPAAPRLMHNIEQAGEVLGGYSARSVARLIADGDLRSVMIGSRRFVRAADLEGFVDELRDPSSPQ